MYLFNFGEDSRSGGMSGAGADDGR